MKHLADNYRPISLLDTLYKIYTNVLTKRLTKFVEENRIMATTQFGGQKGKGTADAIITLTNMMEDRIQHREEKQMYACFIDFQKAFDSLEHWRIIQVLQDYGVPEKFIQSIQGIYKGANAYITTPHGDTEKFPVTRGVRQGDTLSPLLFNLGINPLIRRIDREYKGYSMAQDINIRASILAYMDDLTLLSDDPKALDEMVNLVADFGNLTGLKMNAKKTQILTTKGNHQTEIMQRNTKTMQDEKTTIQENTKNVRYLGVVLNLNLDWEPAAEEMKKNVLKKLAILDGKRYPTEIKTKIINIIINKIIEYQANFIHISEEIKKEITQKIVAVAKHSVPMRSNLNPSEIWVNKEHGGEGIAHIDRVCDQGLVGTICRVGLNDNGTIQNQTTIRRMMDAYDLQSPQLEWNRESTLKENGPELPKNSRMARVTKALAKTNIILIHTPKEITHIQQLQEHENRIIETTKENSAVIHKLLQLRTNTNPKELFKQVTNPDFTKKWKLKSRAELFGYHPCTNQEYERLEEIVTTIKGDPIPGIFPKLEIKEETNLTPVDVRPHKFNEKGKAQTICWTDGSNKGPDSGWGVCFGENHEHNFWGATPKGTTIDTAELMAIEMAIKRCPKDADLTILSDSQNAINEMKLIAKGRPNYKKNKRLKFAILRLLEEKKRKDPTFELNMAKIPSHTDEKMREYRKQKQVDKMQQLQQEINNLVEQLGLSKETILKGNEIADQNAKKGRETLQHLPAPQPHVTSPNRVDLWTHKEKLEPFEGNPRKEIERADTEKRIENMKNDKEIHEFDLKASAIILNDTNTREEERKMVKKIRSKGMFTRKIGYSRRNDKNKHWKNRAKFYQDPKCPSCNQEESSFHFQVGCKKLEEIRRETKEELEIKMAKYDALLARDVSNLPSANDTVMRNRNGDPIITKEMRIKMKKSAGYITKGTASHIRANHKKEADEIFREIQEITTRGLIRMWEERNRNFKTLCEEINARAQPP